ncbi:metallophosphoesterase [Tengunoibacter tsumagoiensis]|uniref:Serine/threonine protein phosphatase n=1 Tax=Tengunoibacter tsumagoiensis TaxID=2014871 RepID=A0A402A1K1_9CHLR|nr:metallophosphoesterase [Tengunoibacter tsumagoiensis]GCE13040.1 serine/threonine protein phosphatase [Tengunoibacter tsumagoiensis]
MQPSSQSIGVSDQRNYPIYLMGDVHGQLQILISLLQKAYLIDEQAHWIGEQSHLWFLGDLVDRGPDSIGVLDLVMRLQREAQLVGGAVESLLGNHEVLLLGASKFGKRLLGGGNHFLTRWRRNGGKKEDLGKLTPAHLTWIESLPAIARVEHALLIHADSSFYTRYGTSIAEVNTTLYNLLQHKDLLAWEDLWEHFASRGVFSHQLGGDEYVERFLSIFGGEQIIHGHTPIHLMVGGNVKSVTQPYSYAQGRCLNLDGGIFLGGPGFLHQITAPAEAARKSENLPL